MSVWVVLPIKNGSEVKSRLAGTLNPKERRSLSRLMIASVLSAIERSLTISGIVVVTGNSTVLPVVEKVVERVADPGGGLNAAIDAGIAAAVRRGASSVLVLPSDLPLIDSRDLDAIVTCADFERGIVIAPSRRLDGTNALLIRPPSAFQPAFGPDSFAGHLRRAEQVGLEVRIYRSSRTAFDLDTPDDLAELRRRAPGWRTTDEVLTAKLD